MAKLEAGATAPAFTLPDQDGKASQAVRLQGSAGHRLLLPGRRHAGLHQGGVPVQRQPQDL